MLVRLEELAELAADLASFRLVVFPFVCVDAQGCVWLFVSEAPLNRDEVLVECEQHAGVAVAEVVQCRLGRSELGGFDCPVERGAGDLALKAGLVSGCEDEGVWVEARTAFG